MPPGTTRLLHPEIKISQIDDAIENSQTWLEPSGAIERVAQSESVCKFNEDDLHRRAECRRCVAFILKSYYSLL